MPDKPAADVQRSAANRPAATEPAGVETAAHRPDPGRSAQTLSPEPGRSAQTLSPEPGRPPLTARRPIGAHVPVSGGLATGGLRYATAVAAEAIQVFVSNPRGWARAQGDARQDAVLREHVTLTGLPVFIHAPYLVNVGSPDPVIRQRSAELLRYSLLRGAEIGARGIVAHTGSGVAGERADALRRVRDCLLPVLDEIPDDGPGLLLEPMAGKARCSAAPSATSSLTSMPWTGIRMRTSASTPATCSPPATT